MIVKWRGSRPETKFLARRDRCEWMVVTKYEHGTDLNAIGQICRLVSYGIMYHALTQRRFNQNEFPIDEVFQHSRQNEESKPRTCIQRRSGLKPEPLQPVPFRRSSGCSSQLISNELRHRPSRRHWLGDCKGLGTPLLVLKGCFRVCTSH